MNMIQSVGWQYYLMLRFANLSLGQE